MRSKKFSDLREDLYERSPESRDRVTDKTRELADQLGLSELRALRDRTQTQLAEAIGTTQSGVSRIERQQDLMVSTLSDYVAATGGTLRLVASYGEFETEIDLPVLRARRDDSASSARAFQVVWQNPDTRRFVDVGWLRYDGRLFSFSYSENAHLDPDFEVFAAFPDLDRTYESRELFGFFAERVASTAVATSLPAVLGIDPGEATPVELLARSWGRQSQHDTIHVVPEPVETAPGVYTRFFLASGVSHIDENNRDAVSQRIAALRRGAPLELRDEPGNPVDPRAILLLESGERVGWIPNYLLDQVHKDRENGNDVRVFVEHANGPDIAWHLRLLCRLDVARRNPG